MKIPIFLLILNITWVFAATGDFDSLCHSLKMLEIAEKKVDSIVPDLKVIIADSAKFLKPSIHAVLSVDPVLIEIKPEMQVDSVLMIVRYGSRTVDTIGTVSKSPYEFKWDCSGIPDQDQIHLQFGYTLFVDSLVSIVSPPLPHRWMLKQDTWRSRRVFHAHQTIRPDVFSIDGNLDDWNGVRKIKTGNAGYARMCWTIGKLYFAAFVKDNSVCPGDYLELHFDMYNDKSDFAGKNHRSIRFSPRGRTLCFTVDLNDSGFTPADSVAMLIQEHMEWRTVVKEDGYVVEAAIPFFCLSDLMYPSMKSGFDLTVVDVNEHSDTIFHSWAGNKDLFCRYSPSRWGTLKLHQAMISLHFFMLAGGIFFAIIIFAIIGWLLKRHYTDSKIDEVEEMGYSETMDRIITSIKKNLSSPDLSLSIIAEKTSLEPELIKHTVEQEAACSVDYLVLKERINCSKRLLSSEAYAIEEIIKTAGFKDKEIFEKVFKEMTRTTPKNFFERKRADALEEQG
jgi:AraC-like DNA-binding protein